MVTEREKKPSWWETFRNHYYDGLFYGLLVRLAQQMVRRLHARGLPAATDPHWVNARGKMFLCHGEVARINQYRVCTECSSIYEEN